MEKKLNIPNVLSAYRIAALPFITWTIFSGDDRLFIILLSVNLVTDILDGAIARRFNMMTEFGARLDSLADLGTYAMAFAGMIVLKSRFANAHAAEFFCLIALIVLVQVVSLLRFRKLTSFHLYTSKIAAYLQGIFIFVLFLFRYNAFFYYPVLIFSFISELEGLLIVSMIPALRTNVKGVYFILKENGKLS